MEFAAEELYRDAGLLQDATNRLPEGGDVVYYYLLKNPLKNIEDDNPYITLESKNMYVDVYIYIRIYIYIYTDILYIHIYI